MRQCVCKLEQCTKFQYSGNHCIVLDQLDFGTLVMCLDPVLFTFATDTNNFMDSGKEELLLRLYNLNEHKGEHMVLYDIELTALNGDIDYGPETVWIAPLTLADTNRYRDVIPPREHEEWTSTPCYAGEFQGRHDVVIRDTWDNVDFVDSSCTKWCRPAFVLRRGVGVEVLEPQVPNPELADFSLDELQQEITIRQKLAEEEHS